MPTNPKIWRRVVPAALIGAVASWGATVAMAADTKAANSNQLDEIVVTGSSIKQNADALSLPVTIVTAEQIAKTGVTSVTDLIQNLPSMQGFVPASSSVNGGGGGITTAAIHGLPSKYTLTLIDGQRVAPYTLGQVQGAGSGVNIESIPLSAIERVEVLTDGASALYGADAIAGVVNFILKKDQTDGNVYYNASVPSASGGNGWNAGFSKGFGSLSSDNYNVLFTYGHDVQYKLQASQRAVSRRGAFFPFSANGNNYYLFNPTSNTEPANVTIGSLGVTYNPFYQANGNCGTPNAFPLTTSQGLNCRFNYAATVEDIPSSVRDSGMVKGSFNVSENNTIWAEVLVSKIDLTSQYAPPAQPLGVNATTRLPALWNAYVLPYLTANNVTATRATINYRAVSAGGRTDDWGTATRHIVLGWNGKYNGFDVNATATISHGQLTDTAAGGYLDYSQLASAIASGAYDPVLGTGAGSLKTAVLNSVFSTTTTDLRSFKVDVQHAVLDLSGGPSILSVGAEYDSYSYKTDYSDLFLSSSGFSTQPASTDYPVGGNYGQVPFQADRTNWGLFGEWKLPIEKNLEVTASVRYDNYAKLHSNEIFAAAPDPTTGVQNQIASGSQGNTFDDATGKLSFRYAPIDMVAIRGSYGTGFKAPTLSDISGPLVFGGSTSGTYACPFKGSVGCLPGSAQYDLLLGANGAAGATGLKPEKSRQWTLGVQVKPIPELSLGLDYWNVRLKDQIQSAGIAEQVAYNDPNTYATFFVNPYLDPAGFQTIALKQIPFNGGEAHYSGIDWNFNYRTSFDWGKFSAAWSGSYTLKQNYTNYEGGPTLSDLGVYGPDQQVVFKTITSLVLGLETGKWANTISGHYKSGYQDQSYTAKSAVVFSVAPGGGLGAPVDFGGLQVPSYVTFDLQTAYNLLDNVTLTFGINNVSDKSPPLSLQTGGGGNQIGYDGRYYDPLGRVYYFRGSVKF